MRMIRGVLVFGILATLGVPSNASGKQFRVNQLPNGSRFSCDTCHEAGNTGYVNPFGVNVLSHLTSSGDVKWEEFYDQDADGDGYTNGYELGDPDGEWRIGDPAPGGDVTHPGFKDDSPCDNGRLDPGEECDSNDVGGATCEMLGFIGGTVSCTDCKIDTYTCTSCGNDIADDEPCDGTDLKGADCTSFGFDGGTLTCTATCTLDISACEGSPTPVCGDGVRVPGEDCEGKDLGPRTCASLGWSGGTLKCADDCTFDLSACFGAPPGQGEVPEVTPVPGASDDATDDAVSGDEGCNMAPGAAPSLFALMVLGLGRRRRRTPTDPR